MIVEEDSRVDTFHRARENVRAEEGLVGVDADPPDALLARRVERTEAAAAGNLEDDARAVRDLVQRDLLALRLVVEVLRVAVQQLDPRIRRLRAGLVAGDEAVDRRLLLSADGADYVLARPPLLLERREIADEVAGLLLAEEQALQVRRLVRLNAWSTSMIAKFEFGKRFATVSIASPSVKPTPIVRS